MPRKASADFKVYNENLCIRTEGASMGFDIQPQYVSIESRESLLPEVREMTTFGRWKPVSQVSEES